MSIWWCCGMLLLAGGAPAKGESQKIHFPRCSGERGMLTLPVRSWRRVSFSRLGSELQPVVVLLQKHPGWRIRLEAHTNSRGSRRFNLLRSQKGAQAVRNYLLKKGIAPLRVSAQGYGEECPLASNRTRAGRKKNSRLVVVRLGAGKKTSSATVISAKKTPRLPKLFFGAGAFQLSSQHKKKLVAVLSILRSRRRVRLRIEAHEDVREGKKLPLSQKRGQAVRAYLLQQGIASDRLRLRSYGPTRPIASNRTRAGRAKNRRVEFRFVP